MFHGAHHGCATPQEYSSGRRLRPSGHPPDPPWQSGKLRLRVQPNAVSFGPMAIAPGTRLGSYEVVSPLGAGGMGEVFRARDLKLGREVALKVLPAEFSANPDRMRRFEREARSASALNHPHIVTVYDIGQSDSNSYIAMELVDGRTLRDLLGTGPLPLKKVLHLAAQLADGLSKAHASGIVHRDLKPENVMVTRDGFAKILDFGLAKATVAEPQSSADSPTLPSSSTIAGMVVGTAAYMSPEQARGSAVDYRSDQFSFGSVLYEMITGVRAFRRDSAAQTLTAIIEAEPRPIGELNPKAPAPLRWVVERCLAKDPEERYASTRDLARDLASIRDHLSETSMPQLAVGAPSARIRPRHQAWLALLVAALIAAGLAGYRLGRPQASGPLSMRALTFAGSDSEASVSPDGRTVAFQSARSGLPRIWLKQLDGGDEVPLTAGPDSRPRFSPDGATILFIRWPGRPASVLQILRTADLYRVAAVGGEPRKLLGDVVGADWSPEGTQIVFVRNTEADGALATEVGILDANGENSRVLTTIPRRSLGIPRWSQDGKSIVMTDFLFGIGGASSERGHTVVNVEDGRVQILPPPLPGGDVSPPAWLGSGGEAIYTQGESGARVGAASWGSTRVLRLKMATGEAQVLFSIPAVAADVEVLDRGRLLFTARSTRQNLIENSLPPGASERWLTRGSGSDRQPIFSPDAEWVAFTSNRSGNLEIWAISTRTGSLRRLTDHAGDDWDPAFMQGGKRILWSSNRGGHFEIWTAEADGSRPRQVSQDGADAENPTATPDGQWIVYQSGNPQKRGLWKIRADGSEAKQLVEGTTAWPEVSPDGQYALYTILQPDRRFVRVVRLADGQVLPFQIAVLSGAGSGRARWMPDGRAIGYVDEDEQGRAGVFAQDFDPGRDTSKTRRPLAGFSYDLEAESFAFSPDGSRIVVAMLEFSSNLLVAEGVPGVERVSRKK